MDFNKGFLAKTNLVGKDYMWTQKIDYENALFHSRDCFEIGHLAKSFPKVSQKNEGKK